VVSVNTAGTAYIAGIRVMDLIVSINDQTMESVDDIHRILSEWPLGQTMPLVLIRGQERLEFEVVPTEANQ